MRMKAKKIVQSFNKCVDCGVQLVKSDAEIICPKCGLVQQFIDGVQ